MFCIIFSGVLLSWKILNVVIVEHPSGVLGGAALAIADVGIVVRGSALSGSAAQHTDDTETDRGDGEGGAPAVVENVKADVAIGVDVGVTRGRGHENNLGCLHRVVRREDKAQCILFILVHAACGASDGHEPFVHALRLSYRHTGDRRVLTDRPFSKFTGEAALSDPGEFSPTR